VGPSHSDNMIVINFPAERTLFAVDIVQVKRLPFMTLPDAYFPGWMEALERVEAIDFDILAPGHGQLGGKKDVADNRRYLEDLHAAVLAGLRDGRSVEDMQKSITLEAYADWGQYEAWRPLNIQGMAANIALHRRGN
jgi:glyoxylase-like metal-dependent hydrolase (beta-lactamase superfamily II)